jgi:hypothetical protein
MTLYNTLKEYGMFSNELRTRLSNNQILVNGNPKQAGFDLGNVIHIYDQGFFLEELYKIPNYYKFTSQLLFLSLVNLMSGESNIENELIEFLKDFRMIQTSKDIAVFVKISKTPVAEVVIHREGSSETTSKIEKPKEVGHVDEINKLTAARDRLNKQLSNPGFVKNAPQFKIDDAKKRLADLNSKLRDETINEVIVSRFSDFE